MDTGDEEVDLFAVELLAKECYALVDGGREFFFFSKLEDLVEMKEP